MSLPSDCYCLYITRQLSEESFLCICIFVFLPMRLSLLTTHSHHCSSPPSIIFIQYPSFPYLFPSYKTRTPPASPRMDSSLSHFRRHRRKDKLVVFLGATGTGKSKLSIDIASHFPSEAINSDKMQVYRGLDITTNKIPIPERRGVPHHLLGEIDLHHGEFTPSDYRSHGSSIISDITSRRKLPLVVGGSNSFIHALLVNRFDPELDVFDESSPPSLISSELRYKCCFLWVDVSFPVLAGYLSKRVDEMLDSGMLDELAEFFDPEADDLEEYSEHRSGLRKAIGVPEFDRYFSKYPPSTGTDLRGDENDTVRKRAYKEAVRAIKDNTCQLAKRQIWKILRLKSAGWDLRRIDATAAFREAMTSAGAGGESKKWTEIWERQVVEPSVKIVKRFLKE